MALADFRDDMMRDYVMQWVAENGIGRIIEKAIFRGGFSADSLGNTGELFQIDTTVH